MPFVPGSPPTSTTWTPDTDGSASTWDVDSIAETYDLLVDVDGNYIVDLAGGHINLGGGINPGSATTSITWQNSVNGSATWTSEG